MKVKYKVVEICDENNDSLISTKNNSIVIVPSQYITKSSSGDCYVRYPKPPLSHEDLESIKDYVARCIYPPPPTWIDFKCSLLANAGINYKKKLLVS